MLLFPETFHFELTRKSNAVDGGINELVKELVSDVHNKISILDVYGSILVTMANHFRFQQNKG